MKIRNRAWIALVACCALLSAPLSAHAAFGLKVGFFTPADPDAYGSKTYEIDPTDGAFQDKWFALGLYAGARWDNGLGVDIGTMMPNITSHEYVVCTGFSCYEEAYERIVWPLLYISGRYTMNAGIAPYIGGGVGIYKVTTDYRPVTGTDVYNEETLPGIHVMAGLEMLHNRWMQVNFEVRYDRTAPASDSGNGLHDGGDLGGLLISGGVSW